MYISTYSTITIILLLSSSSLTRTAIAISGGIAVESPDQYPFSVTLTKPILCGGTIISLDPPWILTAAHCIESFESSDIGKQSVAYGDISFSKQAYARIKRAIIHPLYISSQQFTDEVYSFDRTEVIPYDIGLIQLEEPLVATRYVNRIPISTYNLKKEQDEQSLQNGQNITSNDTNKPILETIGMGYIGVGQPHAEILQSTECTLSASEHLKDDNYNHSIILTNSIAGLCHGDSGNPLLYRNEQGEYFLQGVLNRIFNAYDPDPATYTCPVHENNATTFVNSFVRPAAHLKWIMKVTQLSKDALTGPMTAADVDNNSNNLHTAFTSDASAKTSMSSMFIPSFPLLFILCCITFS